MGDHAMSITVIASLIIVTVAIVMMIRAVIFDHCSFCGQHVRTRTIDKVGRCTSCRIGAWHDNAWRGY
jgi:hypothetical protein